VPEATESLTAFEADRNVTLHFRESVVPGGKEMAMPRDTIFSLCTDIVPGVSALVHSWAGNRETLDLVFSQFSVDLSSL